MIEKRIRFLIELDKLKAVERRNYPIGINRKENSAEHSWSLAVAAMTLAPSIDPELDVFRIIQMLLLHDIVEIDAGDIDCYGDQTGKYEDELSAAERIFGILPTPESRIYLDLWEEFEAGYTKESIFANALDRILPLIQNFHGKGRVWRENKVFYEQAFQRNQQIKDASIELWSYADKIMKVAFDNGWLPAKNPSEQTL